MKYKGEVSDTARPTMIYTDGTPFERVIKRSSLNFLKGLKRKNERGYC